jgi:hypothetical protein
LSLAVVPYGAMSPFDDGFLMMAVAIRHRGIQAME